MHLINRGFTSACLSLSIAAVVILASGHFAAAGSQTDMGGWEIDSPYNRMYNAAELDSFKGRVARVRTGVPMKGMSPATILKVEDEEGEVITVHLCPEWYLSPKELQVRRGQRVRVRGVWAFIGDEDVFMASKVKRDDGFEVKVRLTSDGTPFWTMSQEALAREKRDQ